MVETQDHPSSRRAPLRLLVMPLALLLGATVAAVFLAAMPPVTRPSLPDDAGLRGEALERSLAAELTAIRPPGEEWAIAIDPADINAWLATRLPKWIEHDPGLADLAPAVAIRIAAIDGALVIEDSARPSGAPVVSLPLEPALESGRLRLGIGTARIGRLPVPGSAAALAAFLSGSLDELASGNAGIRLSDGRRVELRAISCEPRRIALLLATVPAASP